MNPSGGDKQDFGVTEDSKLYFNLSTPGRFFENPTPTPPNFNNPRQTEQQVKM
jgi:Mn-containing catalase